MAKCQKGKVKVSAKDKNSSSMKLCDQAVAQAVALELPWVSAHFRIAAGTKVSFPSVDLGVLARDCEYQAGHNDGFSYVSPRNGALIKLFARDGLFVGVVGSVIKTIRRPEVKLLGMRLIASSTRTVKCLFPETIDQALKRLDTRRDVYYIVGQLGGEEPRLVITRPREGFDTVQDSIENELILARKLVREKLDLEPISF